jgi:hypothetical protein
MIEHICKVVPSTSTATPFNAVCETCGVLTGGSSALLLKECTDQTEAQEIVEHHLRFQNIEDRRIALTEEARKGK